MVRWKWVGMLSIVLWGTGLMVPASTFADNGSYTLEALKLKSAGDLVDICSIEPGHDDYTAGLAFCYGFFEGTIRYAEAISGAGSHKDLICAPAGTTRLEAVEVFVSYMNDNTQYLADSPVDGIYRALIPRWPCAE